MWSAWGASGFPGRLCGVQPFLWVRSLGWEGDETPTLTAEEPDPQGVLIWKLLVLWADFLASHCFVFDLAFGRKGRMSILYVNFLFTYARVTIDSCQLILNLNYYKFGDPRMILNMAS